MAVTINAKGTGYPSFTIGKGGATIYQGTSLPNNSNGNAGDFYIYANGSSSELFQKQGSTWTAIASGGNVIGPLTSTNTAIARFNGTTGGSLEDSGVLIDVSNNITGLNNLTANGTVSGSNLSGTNTGDQSAGTGLSLSAGTFSIGTNAVTYSLMQQVSGTAVLLGGTAAASNIREISIGTGLTLNSGTLQFANGPYTFTGAQIGGVTSLTSSSGTTAVNLALDNNFSMSLTENTILANPSNAVAGQSGNITITQNAGTAYSLAFSSNWISIAGTTPTISTTLGVQNLLAYYVGDSSHIWYNVVTHGIA